MKLLILTQIVDLNDDVLGFMHGWITEFAKNCELVTVICLKKGEVNLPNNVKVLSLGKETGRSRIKYIYNFYKYIWRYRGDYDNIFVHMNQEYVIMGGLLWKWWGKKTGLWYAHGHVPLSLRIAEKLSRIIFTSTKSGFRLRSDKVNVIGQGIDINKFKPGVVKKYDDIFKIITVGRISPVKDYETLIKAVELLNEKGVKINVKIIGGAGLPEQEKYLADLKKMTAEKKFGEIIKFVGAIPNKNIMSYLMDSDLFVNTSRTGSLDKAIVEAMACGLPVLTCNEALIEVLGEYREMLMYGKGDFSNLAEKIKLFHDMEPSQKEKISQDLRDIVIKSHSLERFIKIIIQLFQKL